MVPTGKWFACFSIETDVILPPRKEGPIVGIDVGLERVSMRSNRDKVETPRFFGPRKRS